MISYILLIIVCGATNWSACGSSHVERVDNIPTLEACQEAGKKSDTLPYTRGWVCVPVKK